MKEPLQKEHKQRETGQTMNKESKNGEKIQRKQASHYTEPSVMRLLHCVSGEVWCAVRADLWSRGRKWGGGFLCFGGFHECIKLRVVLVRACRANRPPRCNNNLDSCSVCLRWGNGGGGRSCELQRKRLNSWREKMAPGELAGATTGKGWGSAGGRAKGVAAKK